MRKTLYVIVCVLLCLCMLGCNDLTSKLQDTKLIVSLGFEKGEVFQLDTLSCMEPEVYVYLTDMQIEYESVFGNALWTYMNDDGKTMGERLKDNAIANISQIKAMHLLADKRDVFLDEEEIQKALQAAKTYFGNLKQNEIEVLMVDEENLFEMYKEYALANKVYSYIIKDINPEISDDEARTIIVKNIFLQTYSLNGLSEKITFTEDKKKETYNKIFAIKKRFDAGEDFDTLSSEYSDDKKQSHSIGKGDTTSEYEEVAFSLAEGETSEVIETENGYFIIQCISSFDLEQTQRNKIKIIEERKKQVFEMEYLEFVNELPKNMNIECWEKIKLINSEDLPKISFFEVYEQYFSSNW